MATVNGKNLVVKFGTLASEVVVACSQTCTFTLNQDMTDVTCKDADSWRGIVEGMKSGEVTVDALYQDDDSTSGFRGMSDLIITGPNDCSVVFEELNNPNYSVTNPTWQFNAKMSTCTLNGDDNAAATYSATFMSNGAITFTEGTDA